MNRHLRDMLMKPYRDEARGRDRADYGYDNRGRDMNYDNRSGNYYLSGTYDNGYAEDYSRDERRGVRGSGRGRDRDYEDMNYEMDRHFEKMKYLKPHQIHEWMEKIGARWKKDQLMPHIQKENIRFDSQDYTEDEFVALVNLKYSDYKDILGSSPEIYVKMAKKFFDDKKSMVNGGEKLASLYYAMYYDGR